MLSNVWVLKSVLFKNIQTYILVCRAYGGNWSCKYDLYFRFRPNCRLMTVTNRLTADCWLWLTKQANTFCRFSWSLKANLEMAGDYCHLPDSSAYPTHIAPSSCLICHWHWCIFIFPCCSLLFCSFGNVLRKVWNLSDYIERQRFLESYKLFLVFCWNP